MMAALIYAKREHLYQVDSLSHDAGLGSVDTALDGLHELPLVEELQRQGRAFLKPLRYDASALDHHRRSVSRAELRSFESAFHRHRRSASKVCSHNRAERQQPAGHRLFADTSRPAAATHNSPSDN
jgi:hypothetical protein